MAGKKEIRDLSDSELLSELKSLGLKIGPISLTTRRVYEKRLSKARGCDVVDSTCENQDSRASVGEDACTKLANSITDCTNRTSGLLESPAVFYGVCFDVARSSSESGLPSVPVVFTSKDEALKTAKKFKGARFKGFKTRVEAESFSQSRSTEQENSPAVTSTLYSPTDPVSNFKGPTPQELVKFRKVIENGSREEFREIALKNPRYLIGPGDTPVVLQEGFRYNALHVAVKHNRKEMCQLIVDTLESQDFWNILLNQDTQSALNSQRRQFLVDMYLNTPDKGNWETPLHFACKYGYAAVVEYLVSHPLTDVQRTNKYGKTPAQVICSRCTAPSSELKSQIKSYLEDSFYVPLMGTMDNSTPPWIGGPWSPEVRDGKNSNEPGSQGSPLDSLKPKKDSPGELPITVKAYAGPMSPSKAEEFYRSWKTPPKLEQRSSYIQIKRKDDSRGVERIGRQLAHQDRIPWTEYWNFLGCYADLSTSQGLEKLEDYLAKKRDRIVLSRLSVTPQRVRTLKSSSSIVPKTPESRQSSVILSDNGLLRQTGNTSFYEHHEESCTMDYSDGLHSSSRKTLFLDSESEAECDNRKVKQGMILDSKQRNMNAIGNLSTYPALNQTSDVKSNEPVMEALAENLDTLSLHKEQVELEGLLERSLVENLSKQHLTSNVGCVDEIDDMVDAGVSCKKKLSYNFLGTKDENLSGTVSMELDAPMRIKLAQDKIVVEENCENLLQNTANESPSSSLSLLSSPCQKETCALGNLQNHCYDDEVFENNPGAVGFQGFKMPDNRGIRHVKFQSCSHGDVNIFIQGLQPSKLDLDVLIAIGQTYVDFRKYPCIAQWKKLVMSYSEEKQQSWPSPGSPRYNSTRHKSLMWSC